MPGADDAFGREDRFGREGRFECEDPFGGSVPGADDDRLDRDGVFGGSVPGADDDRFDSVLPSAARLSEAPVPISATMARAASGRSFLIMFGSCV